VSLTDDLRAFAVVHPRPGHRDLLALLRMGISVASVPTGRLASGEAGVTGDWHSLTRSVEQCAAGKPRLVRTALRLTGSRGPHEGEL
jgi:hypothetical protein